MRRSRSVLRGSQRRKRPIEFPTPPFCQGLRITEKGLDAEDIVKPMVLGELAPIIEADGLAHWRWGLFIGRTMNHAEAALSFVENHQPLTTSGEHHEVGLPMAWRLAAVDLGRSFGDRAPVFDETGGAAASSPASSHFLVTRQQTIPVILLGRTMIDEMIDWLMADDGATMRQSASDLLRRTSHRKAFAHAVLQVWLARQLEATIPPPPSLGQCWAQPARSRRPKPLSAWSCV